MSDESHDVTQSLMFLLRRAESAVRSAADALLVPAGVTLSQHIVLRLVASEPGSSAADLARRYGVSPRAMTGLLAALESSGLVQRSDHPSHRRIKCISLTPAGLTRLNRSKRLLEPLGMALEAPETARGWLVGCVPRANELAREGGREVQ